MLGWRRSWHLLMQMPQRGSRRVRCIVSLMTAGVALTAVGFLTAALATDRWVVSVPRLLVPVSGNRTTYNASVGESKEPWGSNLVVYTGARGHVNFGFFHGYKCLDNGLGARYGELWVHCIPWRNLCGWEWSWTTTTRRQMVRDPSSADDDDEDDGDDEDAEKDMVLKLLYTIDDSLQAYDSSRHGNDSSSAHGEELISYSSAYDFGLFNCGLWASTVAFVGLGILTGLVVFVLALLNLGLAILFGKMICPTWIFAWMGALEFSTVVATITYAVLFGTNFQHNVLTKDDKDLYKWTTDNSTTTLDVSFYLVVVAAILNCISMLVSCVALSDYMKCNKISTAESQMDGIIMMY